MKVNKLIPLRASNNKFRVVQQCTSTAYKLVSIIFSFDKDGKFRIYIQPYLNSTKGIVSKCIQRPGQSSLSLLPNGYTVSHLTKYSHPVDGNTHISSPGRIFTNSYSRSVRLDKIQSCQIFSITVYGYEAYKGISPESKKRMGDIVLPATEMNESQMLRISGWWAHSSLVKISQSEVGPYFWRETPAGKRRCVIIAPTLPEGYSELSDHFMLLSFNTEAAPHEPSNYTLMGGFDEFSHPDKNYTYLCQSYPLSDFESMSRQIGSLDYVKGAQRPPVKEFLQ